MLHSWGIHFPSNSHMLMLPLNLAHLQRKNHLNQTCVPCYIISRVYIPGGWNQISEASQLHQNLKKNDDNLPHRGWFGQYQGGWNATLPWLSCISIQMGPRKNLVVDVQAGERIAKAIHTPLWKVRTRKQTDGSPRKILFWGYVQINQPFAFGGVGMMACEKITSDMLALDVTMGSHDPSQQRWPRFLGIFLSGWWEPKNQKLLRRCLLFNLPLNKF